MTWWEQTDDSRLARDVLGTTGALKEQHMGRSQAWAAYSSLYANRMVSGIGIDDYSDNVTWTTDDNTPLNIVRSQCDTACAMLTRSKPTVRFLTTEGDFRAKRRAQQLDRFVDGLMHDLQVNRKARQAFRDATVWGVGLLKVFNSRGRITVDRVIPEYVLVDDRDAYNDDPACIYQRSFVEAGRAKALFPKFQDEIDSCCSDPSRASPGVYDAGGRIELIEAWHLPSDPDAEPDGKGFDGRHVIVLGDVAKNVEAVLLDEPWPYDTFPFCRIRWNEDQSGWWGSGLAEELHQIQCKVNEILWDTNESIARNARPITFLPQGSRIIRQHITDEAGTLITYAGQKPTQEVMGSVPQEAVAHMERLFDYAFRITGVSQSASQAKKEPGVTAAVALREINDMQSDRFAIVMQRYEEFILDVCKQLVRVGREIEAGGESVSVKVPGKDFMKKLRLKDIDLEDDRFEMIVHSVSSLPRRPEGRISFIQEMSSAGLVMPPERTMELLDFPDFAGYIRETNAPRTGIEMCLERILDGTYCRPEPFHDLELGLKMFRDAVNLHQFDAPDDVLDMLLRWIDEATALRDALAPPPVDGEMLAEGTPAQGESLQ